MSEQTINDRILTRDETAIMLRKKTNTLAKWAAKGYGPPVIRTGERAVGYWLSDVMAHLNRPMMPY